MKNNKERINKIKLLVKFLRKKYKNDSNITGITWGLAKRGNKLRPEVAIIFNVKEKLTSEEAIKEKGSFLIPKEIEGFKTDVKKNVLLKRQFTGERNDKMYDPLVGGVGSANLEQLNRTFFWYRGGKGTLGILCRDAEGNAMALSNWHVWADNGAEIGDRIIQPSSPDGATYAESITKVAACGPLLSTVIEGRAPSGLSIGLYAGAAAVAILAGATDHKDPIRRGQEMTTIENDTITHEESLNLEFKYPDTIPWVGKPFATDVNWQYKRNTNKGEEIIKVEEIQINPQVLLGYAIAPNRAHYSPGERIVVNASIWDYQNRPSDAYHLIAHLIPESNPNYVLRTILHSSICRPINLAPSYKEDKQQNANPVKRDKNFTCIHFSYLSPTKKYNVTENLGPVSIFNKADKELRVVNWGNLGSAMHVPLEGLILRHPPAKQINLTVAQFTNAPVTVKAYNNFGVLVAEANAPQIQGQLHKLTLNGNMITNIEIGGGGGEGLLFSYCFETYQESQSIVEASEELIKAYSSIDVPFISKPKKNYLSLKRHCFTGHRAIPFNAPTGKYKVYLSVTNINHTPQGSKPEEAAKIIGGQQMGYSSQGLLCGFMLLGDHVFDIF